MQIDENTISLLVVDEDSYKQIMRALAKLVLDHIAHNSPCIHLLKIMQNLEKTYGSTHVMR